MIRHKVQLRCVLPEAPQVLIAIDYACYNSPYGQCFLALSELGICYLGFPQAGQLQHILNGLHQTWPGAAITCNERLLAPVFDQLFQQEAAEFTLVLKGTAFQCRVWQALMQIPAGTVSTYSYMAQTIGNASATRAVASAIAKNPVSLLVPCHRVVPKSGGAGQYLWGVACKQQLLADEGVDYASVDCLKR